MTRLRYPIPASAWIVSLVLSGSIFLSGCGASAPVAPTSATSIASLTQAAPTPCQESDEFRQFDFWLGQWDVHDAAGTFQGRNHISSKESGCYLLEQWTGTSGGTGSSINYYDGARKLWVQHWISQGGTQIQIEGGLDAQGSMVLVGKIHYLSTSQTADFRGKWTPLDDGRVRQFFEQSTDGENWTPWFEGFYSKRDQ